MSRGEKIGAILILIGFCVPMLSMLFAQNYDSHRGFIWNVQNKKIVCWESEQKKSSKTKTGTFDDLIPKENKSDANVMQPDIFDKVAAEQKNTYCIPLSLSFALGIILIATGIGFAVISKKE